MRKQKHVTRFIEGELHTKTPNKNDVRKLIGKNEDKFFVDQSNNTYGFIETTHHLYNGLYDAGEFNNKTTFFMWISLPKLVRNDPSTFSEFPFVGDKVILNDIRTQDTVGIYEVTSLPEHKVISSRTTCIILEKIG